MTGCKERISGVGSNLFTIWATTTAQHLANSEKLGGINEKYYGAY